MSDMCISTYSLQLTLYRWDMSVSEETYTSPPPSGKSRTLASLKQNCRYSRADKHLGSKHPPLLELEPSSYVLDELHLLLRVSDILIRNLIHLADQLDQRQKQRDGAHGNHMQTLQTLVNSCGVQFKVTQVHSVTSKITKM